MRGGEAARAELAAVGGLIGPVLARALNKTAITARALVLRSLARGKDELRVRLLDAEIDLVFSGKGDGRPELGRNDGVGDDGSQAVIGRVDQQVHKIITPEIAKAATKLYLTGCGDSHYAGVASRLAFDMYSGVPTAEPGSV